MELVGRTRGETELPPAADEAGTAPGDRRFRPDIEGLRAVAVLLVVLYHAGVGGLSGGYVGVDVFFVISGFVITGVLLREHGRTGRTSLLGFYGRRSRRIIPAATVVIVVTVIVASIVLGVIYGDQTAVDARWTAVFLANFHFASVGTNYLTAHQPPSPLLNFWSLAVEEQFYLVYPTLFLVIAALRGRWTLRAKLVVGLVAVVVASFTLSVVQTASDPTVAYFSPFTRAWELALGALVAVGTQWLLTLPRPIGAVLTWGGLAAIAFGAVRFNSQTAYPGSLVAIPVVGTCLVIAGGTNTPRRAAESVLGLAPVRWIGKLSYSIYLWHWPILVIAADAAGSASLPFRQNVRWLLVALGASVISFYLVEAPIRRASSPPLSAVRGLGTDRTRRPDDRRLPRRGHLPAQHPRRADRDNVLPGAVQPLRSPGPPGSGPVGHHGEASGRCRDPHHVHPHRPHPAPRRRASGLGGPAGPLLAGHRPDQHPRMRVRRSSRVPAPWSSTGTRTPPCGSNRWM